MSEQLVIILLIALTFLIVLVAIAIPNDPSPEADSLESLPAANVASMNVATDELPDDEPVPIADQSEFVEQGAEFDDARRAAGVPEETGR